MAAGDQAVANSLSSSGIGSGNDFAQADVARAQAEIGAQLSEAGDRSTQHYRENSIARRRDQLSGEHRVPRVNPQANPSRSACQQALEVARSPRGVASKLKIENTQPPGARDGQGYPRVSEVGGTDSKNLERLTRHF
ncbi:MAG: hypothetical protein ACT4PZ_21300, partial [Panacagrimonas sp.]